MARSQISIKMEPDTLNAVDRAAEERGITRTAFIEWAVERGLRDHEAVLESMAKESAIEAVLLDAILSNKKLLFPLAKLVAKEVPEERIAALAEVVPALREAARKRKQKSKGKDDVG